MKVKLDKLSGSLQKRRLSVLDAYDAEQLHQLRVGLRRMRSYLKTRSGNKARTLRHELGKLADATGPARDWDTLVEKAPARLDPLQRQLLEQDLWRHQAASHLPALAMLEDDSWVDVMQQWDAYLRRHPPGDKPGRPDKKTLRRVRRRVDHAWQRADHSGSPRKWHKLRIAVKDLRYRLEADEETAGNRKASRLLKRCKRLQSLLGDWHDTVVHLQLVRQLAGSYDPDRDVDKLRVIREWSRGLEAEGQRCLDETKAIFRSAGMASLL